MQEDDVVLTLLEGDNRIKKVLDKLENEGFEWNGGEPIHKGYEKIKESDINIHIHYKNKRITYSGINYIDTNFKDITIDEFLGISNLTFNSIITSTVPLYIEFKDRNKFKRFIMECYMREDDVFSLTKWDTLFNKLITIDSKYLNCFIYVNSNGGHINILYKHDSPASINIINGDDIIYSSVSKETINSIISPIIKNGEVIRNYKEIVDVIAKLKEL